MFKNFFICNYFQPKVPNRGLSKHLKPSSYENVLMDMLILRNVTYSIDGRRIVDEVNMQFKEGMSYSILGGPTGGPGNPQ